MLGVRFSSTKLGWRENIQMVFSLDWWVSHSDHAQSGVEECTLRPWRDTHSDHGGTHTWITFRLERVEHPHRVQATAACHHYSRSTVPLVEDWSRYLILICLGVCFSHNFPLLALTNKKNLHFPYGITNE